MSTQRRHYTGSEKVAILPERLPEKPPMSDVCQKHGLTPDICCEGPKTRFERGAMLFDSAIAAARPNGVDARKMYAALAKI